MNLQRKREIVKKAKGTRKKNFMVLIGFDSDLDDILYNINVANFLARKFDIRHMTRCWRWRHLNNWTCRYVIDIGAAAIADRSSH